MDVGGLGPMFNPPGHFDDRLQKILAFIVTFIVLVIAFTIATPPSWIGIGAMLYYIAVLVIVVFYWDRMDVWLKRFGLEEHKVGEP